MAILRPTSRQPSDSDDLAPNPAGKRTFLVAFPVTGLRSQVLTVSHFHVSVDGKEPAIALRRAISIGYRRYDPGGHRGRGSA